MNLSTLRSKSILGTLILGLASAGSAFSTPTITLGGAIAGDHSGETSSILGASINTFNDWQIPTNYTVPRGDGPVINNNWYGSQSGPTGDKTPYLTTEDGDITINFAKNPIKYFGLFWGSIDSDQTISFTNRTGSTYSYTGDSLTSLGIKANGSKSEYVNFFSGAGEQWTSVVLSSLRCDPFVFDNVASSTAPEPASFMTAALGIGLAALGVIRRRRSLARAA